MTRENRRLVSLCLRASAAMAIAFVSLAHSASAGNVVSGLAGPSPALAPGYGDHAALIEHEGRTVIIWVLGGRSVEITPRKGGKIKIYPAIVRGHSEITDFCHDSVVTAWCERPHKLVVKAMSGDTDITVRNLTGVPSEMRGTSGEDDFLGGSDRDLIKGLGEDDMLRGGSGPDSIKAGLGNDTVSGGNGKDFVQAGSGDDLVSGNAEKDNLSGQNGDDTIAPGAGTDTYFGGSGFDTISFAEYASKMKATFDFKANDGKKNEGENISLSGAEAVVGGKNDDTLVGNRRANGLSGGPGDDLIDGNEGDDELLGGSGADTIDGDLGNDVLNQGPEDGSGDLLRAGDGEDVLVDAPGAADFDGGFGVDRIILPGSDPRTVSLDDLADDGRFGEGDNVRTSIEDVYGGDGPDVLIGEDAGAEILHGAGGDDTIDGRGGDDQAYGEEGDDSIRGSTGTDLMSGGNGRDTATWSAFSEPVTVKLDDAANDGAAGENDHVLSDFEVVFGGSGDDQLSAGSTPVDLHGGSGDDQLLGGPGGDFFDPGTLSGGAGVDVIRGGDGFNNIFGGDGNDTLSGGPSRDDIEGGGGNDDLSGGDGFDLLGGQSGDDVVRGAADTDLLFGGDGSDLVEGDDGDDLISGGFGADEMNGGFGTDEATYGEMPSDISVDLDLFQASVRITSVRVTLDGVANDGTPAGGVLPAELDNVGADIEDVTGGAGADTLTGNFLANNLIGGQGIDDLRGSPPSETPPLLPLDHDLLEGGEGDDTLSGLFGDDTLHGGHDDDELIGGPGFDSFDGYFGDDTLLSNDGVDGERLTCGEGADAYRADPFDILEGCETNLG